MVLTNKSQIKNIINNNYEKEKKICKKNQSNLVPTLTANMGEMKALK